MPASQVAAFILRADGILLNQFMLNSRIRTAKMLDDNKVQISALPLTLGLLGFASGPAAAAVRIEGQVQFASVVVWVLLIGTRITLPHLPVVGSTRFGPAAIRSPRGFPSILR